MKDTGLARGMIFEVCLFVFLLLVVWCVGVRVCVCLGWGPLCFLALCVFLGFLSVLGFLRSVGVCVSWFGCVRGCVS